MRLKSILYIDLENALIDHNHDDFDLSEMYEDSYFESLPATRWAKTAINRIMASGRYDVYIYINPLKNSPSSYTDKVNSVAKHFPMLLDKVVITSNPLLLKGDILVSSNRKWSYFDGEFLEFSMLDCYENIWQDILDVLLPKELEDE